MVYKAVIFDLDGTLVHTSPDYRYKIVGQTLTDLGATFSEQDIDLFWFEAQRDSIIREHFFLEPDLFWKIYKQYDKTESRKQFTKAYHDVDFIKELRQNAYKTGIVTGAPIHIATLEVELLGAINFDTVVVQTANGFKPKPSPQGIEACLNLLRIEKEEAIYVGNAAEDIAAAKNAKVFDVLLVRGEYEFQNISPSFKIHSLYELRQFLGLSNNSD